MVTASKIANATEGPLDLRTLLRFYLPLVLTSQMMTLSVPLINLALSRAVDAQLHLAAYSVCFGMMVFLNAPLLISRDAGSAMATDRVRWRRLVLITIAGGAAVVGLDLLLALTSVGDWTFGRLLEATPRVVAEAKRTALSLAPIPLLVGIRGLYSALALRAQKTRLLTQATFLRLIVLSSFVFVTTRFAEPTASLVGWSLTAGIALETLWIAWVTRPLLADLPGESAEGAPYTLGRMLSFAMPLVVSAFAWTALRPIVNGILGRSADSEAAQASFGVLHPLILLTASALWALQSTHQILGTSDERARTTLRFGILMTVIFTSIVVAIGWIPAIRETLLTRVFTLGEQLLDYVEPAMRGLFVAPFMLGLRACFKGLILASGRTGVISASAAAYILAVTLVGVGALSIWPDMNGAVLGVILITTAECIEATMLGVVATRRFALRGPWFGRG